MIPNEPNPVEKIQSNNEELTTVNDELNSRNLELSQLNSDLTNLISNVQIAIVIVGRDLRIRRFSPMAEKLLSIIPSDMGRPITDIRMRLVDFPELDSLLTEAIDTISSKEREILAKDGRWYLLRIRPYLTVENKVDGAVLSLIDIDAIRRAREYAESIVATLREPLLILDGELRVRSASCAFYDSFGVTREETEGRLIYELGGGQWDIPELRRLLGEILPRQSVFNDFAVEHEFEGLGRRTMLLNARTLGEPGGERESILLSVEDITDRNQAETALKVSETRYRRLFESAKDGVLILDAHTAKITDANPFIGELLGYTHAELLGKELWEIGLFKDTEANKAAVQELQDKHFIRYEDLPLETKAGQRIGVEFVSNVYSEDDHLVIQCNIRDITERKRLEEDLRKGNEDLAAADSAKNQFIAVLSHELRSPVNAIRGWIQILRRPGTKGDDFRTGLEVIDRNSKAQAQLIQDLLDIHRIAAGKIRLELAAVDLHGVVDSAADAMAPAAAEKEIRIEQEIDPAPALISGDPTRLQQVLSNLLGNALKFTPKGGHIRVALRQRGERAEVSVSDTGQGISPAAMPHIFERFRQADPLTSRYQGGLGLGLAISKQLVELHGGTISAHSPGQGKGATFIVSLPLLVADTARPPVLAEGAAKDQSVSLGGILALVVDDEPDAREPLRRVLEEAGAETITVASADEALDAIRQRRPDVIVSDIGMPGRDGYDLLRSIRALPAAQGGRIPAIALTAYVASEDRDRALNAGFQTHLTKPVEPVELIAAVAALAPKQGRASAAETFAREA